MPYVEQSRGTELDTIEQPIMEQRLRQTPDESHFQLKIPVIR